MFCLECGLPVDSAPFDPRKSARKRIGMAERIKKLCKFFFEART